MIGGLSVNYDRKTFQLHRCFYSVKTKKGHHRDILHGVVTWQSSVWLVKCQSVTSVIANGVSDNWIKHSERFLHVHDRCHGYDSAIWVLCTPTQSVSQGCKLVACDGDSYVTQLILPTSTPFVGSSWKQQHLANIFKKLHSFDTLPMCCDGAVHAFPALLQKQRSNTREAAE